MTIEQKRRELFEAWAKNGCGRLSRENSPDCDQYGYQDSHTNLCWQAFNAALDAVVIELKAPHNDYSYRDNEVSGAVKNYKQCRAAIESTGLGLKVKP